MTEFPTDPAGLPEAAGPALLELPAEPDYWPPVDDEFVLTLDDVLVEDGRIAPFSTAEVTHVAMGRYGTVLLVAGEPDLQLTANAGDVVACG